MDALLKAVFDLLRKVGIDRVRWGELEVTGSGEADVSLEDYRKVVDVKFVEDIEKQGHHHHPPPCGGGNGPDSLSWELVKRGKRSHVLRISWSVETPRTIVWLVSWR